MRREKKFAIILPAADEEETIEQLTYELLIIIKKLSITATLFFVVDKATSHETHAILSRLAKNHSQLIVIKEPKNRHVVDAYLRGFTEALKRNYDYIIDMDCGFSHLPTDLPKIIKNLQKGYDCVFGVRPLSSLSYKVPLKRRIYSYGGTLLSNLMLGMKYTDTTSGFNGYTRETLRSLLKKPLLSTGNFWHTELRYRAKNYRCIEVPITYTSPSNRVTISTLKNSFSVLLKLTKDRLKGNY